MLIKISFKSLVKYPIILKKMQKKKPHSAVEEFGESDAYIIW